MSGGIVQWPSPSLVAVPGVTLTFGALLAPAGLTNASPNAPTAGMWRLLPGGGSPAVGLVTLTGGVASDTRVNYRADEGCVVLQVGNGGGATNAVLYANAEARTRVAEGPWRAAAPGYAEPGVAVCGFKAVYRHRLAAGGVGVGHGWLTGPTAAGNPWLGGALAAEGGTFRNDGTRPYVALEAPAGGGPVRVRVRGNDGTVRLFSLNFPIDPLVHYVADWRVYRATRERPALYVLYLNGLLAWSQSMSDGPGPGDQSASPTAANVSVYPFLWNQLDGGTGVTIRDALLYTGYDNPATTDRG